ncbi:GIY-YIG nuclease family protein [Mycoplasmopsis glycophila]|uniref:Excinuclease ABC subunit C n=1 Tax=Mycoplasmopsis glycophila TaxID=171285 RepID=A0A449AV67_9BACT|nr:GIY-YIG nuclease family protein [Mycoplasmopsis glycophila]VEU70370.1 Excinuclease ABC subunit C [Mycoplasmopsis glycophila]
MNQQELQNKLKQVPKKPGVYLWKNENNDVIYVGKAKNLFNRMHQYFKGSINSYKTTKMVSEIAGFDIFVCSTEQEAYILEKNYIEIHKPPFNIQLMDDKRYPYIAIKLSEKLEIYTSFRTNKKNDNSFYYGPFPKGTSARELTHILQRLFLYKNGLLITEDNFLVWQKKFNQAIELLKLKDNTFINLLTEKMHQAAESLNFEVALEYKNSIHVLEKMKEQQIVEISNFKNIDVFSIYEKDNYVFIYSLLYRFGVQIAHLKFSFEKVGILDEILNNFFHEFYKFNELPDQIVLDSKYSDLSLDDDHFQQKLTFPKIGKIKQIIEQANKNNQINYELFHSEIILKNHKKEKLQQEIEKVLNESNKIGNIYLFDNSNLNNSYIVGVAIAYSNLEKNKSLYRKFNHESFVNDMTRKSDVEYMYLTIARFLNSDKNQIKPNDIFIVDGGRQQINEALYALQEANLNNKVFGLVKNDYHKTQNLIDSNFNEIQISTDLHNLFSQMQIEVDRFAKSFMRKKHLVTSFESKLGQLKGIGPKTEKILLENFKDYSAIYNASFDQIASVTNKKVAKIITENLKQSK